MLKLIRDIICLISFLPVICIAGEINVKALDKANWINIETANFNVLTNASEKKSVEIVRELENFHYFFALSLGNEPQNLPEKVAVVLAKNKGTFASLGIPEYYAGVFIRKNGYAIFARCDGFQSSSTGEGNWGRAVVLHELVHLFIHSFSSMVAFPPWYEEGIAEYFGTYIEKGNKIIIGDMSILGNRFYSMFKVNSKIENIDTESLFKMSKETLDIMASSKINEEFVNKFYARSVSVVHYLYADPDRMQQLLQYLYLLKKGFTVDNAFNYIFKMTYSEFDKKVNKYINSDSLVGSAYLLGKDGLEFPDVEYNKQDITKQEALKLLYTKITMLPNEFIDREDINKLNTDIEKLYPGE